MTYSVEFKREAARDLIALAKNEPKAFQKAQALIEELRQHPRTGTGKPEPLAGDRNGQWSRRKVVVLVLTTYGHYEDK